MVEELKRPAPRIATGWPEFDKVTGGGFVEPSLVALGAEPKAGKSTWCQIVSEQFDLHTYYFDFENGRRRFARRALQRHSKLGEQEIEANSERWHVAAAKVAQYPCTYIDRLRPSRAQFYELMSKARESKVGKPILVVIDSLQKLPIEEDDRRLGIDLWLRTFEKARNDFNLVIVIISELKRATGKKSYDPSSAGYKESGDIEYSADLALTMVQTNAKTGECLMAIKYNRDGEVGPVAKYKTLKPYFGMQELPYEAAPLEDLEELADRMIGKLENDGTKYKGADLKRLWRLQAKTTQAVKENLLARKRLEIIGADIYKRC